MEPLLFRLVAQAAPKTHKACTLLQGRRAIKPSSTQRHLARQARRAFTISSCRSVTLNPDQGPQIEAGAHGQPAHKLSQDVTQEEKEHYEKTVQDSKEKQMRSPWMREGSDKPPVARQRSAGAMTKGKLLTTPSRMLKLILPLTTRDFNNDRKDVEPLALLVHPQQPLSYLERLIQSELPTIRDGDRERIPSVYFRAQDSGEDALAADRLSTSQRRDTDSQPPHEEEFDSSSTDYMLENGHKVRTGKLGSTKEAKSEAGKTDRADKIQPDPDHPNFVRWSPSTEIGDFIRDAARGKEFSVDVEGAPAPIYIAVPSFQDRTYYLRMRLRKTSKQIADLADLKKECDTLAHRGAKRVAQGGFAVLVGWWYLVYRLTFETELGWDVMEPVTYLVGLSTLIGGYMWFLYHNREVSYRSAMNFTVSRRQSKLYEQRGFDLPRWENLIEEGNRLRREIKLVAEEYDVDWDERKDELDEKVAEALRKERKKRDMTNKKSGKQDEEEDDDDE